MKIKVAIIFGGKSVEHEVSVISGIQAISSMNTQKYDVLPVYMTKQNEMYIGEHIANIEEYKDIKKLLNKSQRVIFVNDSGLVKLMPYPSKKIGKNNSISVDVAFPIVHGTNMEDGALQGYLKTIGIPFVGCDVTASAIGMDKYIMKILLQNVGIPVLDSLLCTLSDYENLSELVNKIENNFDYPVIVKPVNLGSSVGIGVAKNKLELENALDNAFLYATKIIVERAIVDLREVNCSVLGDENDAIASECEEPLRTDEILSYKDKYVKNAKGKSSKGMASVSRKIPADLSSEKKLEIQSLAIKSFKTLGCNGVSRIDFMIDNNNGKLYFNEINTIPGSLAFYLWKPLGISYEELLDRMIQLALKRYRIESNVNFSFETNILCTANFGGTKGTKL